MSWGRIMIWESCSAQRRITPLLKKVSIKTLEKFRAANSLEESDMAKMTMKDWEKSAMDKKKDAALKKKGVKEGSKMDVKMDKAGLAAYNKKMKKK